jgi:hypothetical protein
LCGCGGSFAGKYCRFIFTKNPVNNNVMKVEGPGKSGSVKGASRAGAKKGADGTAFSDMLEETSGAEAAAPASTVMQISSLDVLLSVQQSDDAGSGAGKRARQRAADLLDNLDQIRLGLLAGGVPLSTLKNLEHMVSRQKENILDPRLSEIIDDIDLRVQVELAKLGR